MVRRKDTLCQRTFYVTWNSKPGVTWFQQLKMYGVAVHQPHFCYFFLTYRTCGFDLKLMFHSSEDCQSLVSASKSLQIPTVAFTKFCIDAFKWNIWNKNIFFWLHLLTSKFSRLPPLFHILRDSLLETSDPGMLQKSWELFRTAAGAQITGGCQNCTCHPPPPLLLSPA